MNTIDFDNIIVGSGLAGTTLFLQLKTLFPNERTLIISNPNLSKCSRIAAGMANPLAFKRLGIIPRGLELMKTSLEFYQLIEDSYQRKIVHKAPTLKFISSTKELNDLSIFLENETQKEISATIIKNINNQIKSDHFLEINSTYWLNTIEYLEIPKSFNDSSSLYIEDIFSFQNLRFENHLIFYSSSTKTYKSNRIFFCEGHLVKDNPYFNWLPMKPAKGETLLIKADALKCEKILNKDAYLVPLKKDYYKLGATYKWNNLNDIPEADSKLELIEKLEKLISSNYTIENQEAAVRPSSKDRQPILGEHPLKNNLYIFNALGTRGVMLAPYYAKMLLNSIFIKESIDYEVSVPRFKKELALLRP